MAPRKTPYDKLNEVLALLKENGWRQTGRGRFTPPYSLIGITPERTPASWWGRPVYPRFRALDLAAVGRLVYWAERQNAPWVNPASQKITVGHVAPYIEEVTQAAQCSFLADGPRPVPVMVPPTDKWGNLL
jgi:hypothetical protein